MRTYTKDTTEKLLQSWRFHDQDNGTETNEQEMRRMYALQEIGEELQRRNVPLPL